MRTYASTLLRTCVMAVFTCALLGCASVVRTASTTGAPPAYRAERTTVQVFDANTNSPVEGAVVVAHWQLQSQPENVPQGELMVIETVTDASGWFTLPGWGPKARTPVTGALYTDDPEILIFKPGYRFQALANPLAWFHNNSPVRRSTWNGKTVGLSPSRGTQEEYANDVRMLAHDIEYIVDAEGCQWKHMPRMLIAIEGERERLPSLPMRVRQSGGHSLL
jgi:hypothetical protein